MVLGKLDAFARAQLPALVVSCKCDAPHRQINPNSIEQVGTVGVGTVGGYETMQTSAALPDSQKKCVNMILGMVIKKNGLCAPILLCFSSQDSFCFPCLVAVILCFSLISFGLSSLVSFSYFGKIGHRLFSVSPTGVVGGGMVVLFRVQVPLSLCGIYFLSPCCQNAGAEKGIGNGEYQSSLVSLGLAGMTLLSFSLNSRTDAFFSFSASTPSCLQHLELVKGQGYLSMAFSNFTASSFSPLPLNFVSDRAHLLGVVSLLSNANSVVCVSREERATSEWSAACELVCDEQQSNNVSEALYRSERT